MYNHLSYGDILLNLTDNGRNWFNHLGLAIMCITSGTSGGEIEHQT